MEIKQTFNKLLHLRLILLRWVNIIFVIIFHLGNEITISFRLFLLHHSIVCKRLSLAVRRLQPLIKGCLRHRSNLTKSLPALGVVGKISLCSSLLRRIAIHHLMLIKLSSLRVHLVNNINITIKCIKVCCVIDEHINMVTIHTNLAQDVAIGVVHGHAPRLALLVLTATCHALRCLYGEVIATEGKMSLLVVSSLLLRLCRLGFGLSDSILQSF